MFPSEVEYEAALDRADRARARSDMAEERAENLRSELADARRAVEALQQKLRDRPTNAQLAAVLEHNRDVEAINDALVKRNEILRRKLREAGLG